MLHIYSGILLSHNTERNLGICGNMVGPRGLYAQLNESDRERKMPYGFTYTWNLRHKTETDSDTENKLARREESGGEGVGGW